MITSLRFILNKRFCRSGFLLGGNFVKKMRRASTNLIGSGTLKANVASASGSQRPIEGASSSASLRSNSRPANGGSSNDVHADSCSSSGSGCGNGDSSLDSGQHSPANATANELILRAAAASASGRGVNGNKSSLAQKKTLFHHHHHHHHHLDDSDGNNADNDSVNSGFSGLGKVEKFYEADSFSTQDGLTNQSYSSHSELGIPLKATSDKRSVSRIYVNGGSDPESQGSITPKLPTTWGVNHSSSPSPIENSAPMVPARLPSRSNAAGSSSEAPPQRPPKPGKFRKGDSNRFNDDDFGDDDSSSAALDDDAVAKKAENAEWYEYGCV